MDTVKIIHCADIHIGSADSSLGTLAEKRRIETLMTFERIIDIAVDNDVKVIAIAGDLFDSNNIEQRFCDAVFDKIASAPDIKVIFSAGNHDPLDSVSPFNKATLPKNLYVLKSEDECICFEELKLCVFGKSFEYCYCKGEESFSLPPRSNYINLMVIHGELKSDLTSNYNAITPNFVKSCSMDYIALGHIHKRSEIGKMGDTYFAYSGCPEGQGFDETDDKGIYIGNIGKGICELEFMPISKRRYICEKLQISGSPSADDIASNILSLLSEKYGDNYTENLYKIELCGEVYEDFVLPKSEICERLNEKLFFAKINNNTKIHIDRETLAKEPTLKGIFVKNMLSKIDKSEEKEKAVLERALEIGLKAFSGEVKWDEN